MRPLIADFLGAPAFGIEASVSIRPRAFARLDGFVAAIAFEDDLAVLTVDHGKRSALAMALAARAKSDGRKVVSPILTTAM